MNKRAIFWVHGGIGKKEAVEFEYREERLLQIISPKALEEYYSKRGEEVSLITFVPHSLYTGDAQVERRNMEKEIKNFEEIPLPGIGRLRNILCYLYACSVACSFFRKKSLA